MGFRRFARFSVFASVADDFHDDLDLAEQTATAGTRSHGKSGGMTAIARERRGRGRTVKSVCKRFAVLAVLPATMVAALALASPAWAATDTFSSDARISVPAAGSAEDRGVASPYPSALTVPGPQGPDLRDAKIADLDVTLKGVTHTNPADLDVLLVGPRGQTTLLASDAGSVTDVTDVDLTFSDEAGGFLPVSGGFADGTYRPTDHATAGGDNFPSPAPSVPFGRHPVSLSVFDGTDPNGEWRLFVTDDGPSNTGSIAGFSLTMTTVDGLVVTTTADTSADDDLVVSLREAVAQANGRANGPGGPDEITFDLPEPEKGPDGRWTIALRSALPDLSEAVVITGPGADDLTVRPERDANSRVFAVGNNSTVSISGLTASGGVAGNLGDVGGGIHVGAGSSLTLTEAAVENNTATERGGGINNAGSLTLVRTTVSGNSAGSDGGGIHNTGTARIENSTVAGNRISESESFDRGGGINNAGSLTLESSTVAGNSAGNGSGGGVYNTASATLQNTIVADNTGRTGADDMSNIAFVSGPASYTSRGHNLIEAQRGSVVGDTSTNITGRDPDLGGLSHNGGPTQTKALGTGSPALDAGDTDLAADQRGVSRPQASADDIGAFERRTCAPTAEPLVVTSTADLSDDCRNTLRDAMLHANATPNSGGPDVISFDIPGTGVRTIAPGRDLPEITEPVVIDGYSQPGSAAATGTTPANILVELSGSDPSTAVGLRVRASDTTVRGLAINRFDRGIWIGGTSNSLANDNTISGNHIGAAAAGAADLGNGHGVWVEAGEGNTIGGQGAASRNVISGNDAGGVTVTGATASSTDITNNLIGPDAAGTGFLGSGGPGVAVRNGAHSTDIAGNTISANSFHGVLLADNGGRSDLTPPITLTNNRIGTDVSGTADLGNGGDGVRVSGTSATTITGNTISGNAGDGVELSDANGNYLGDNAIGTDTSGSADLGNGGHGILLGGGNFNTVGASSPDTRSNANTIANNAFDGVAVTAGNGNLLFSNSIHDNGNLGIDLADDGVTPNDASDTDDGPNGLQNRPVLSSAASVDGATTVRGTLDGTPDTTLDLQFFSSPSADPSGSGEGHTFLGSTRATTDGSGNAGFTATVTDAPVGHHLSATATGGAGTSEFSVSVAVAQGNRAPVASGQSVTTDEDAAKLITLSATDADDNPLTYKITALPLHGALYDGDSTAEADRILAAGTVLSGNKVTYKPDPEYSGRDDFSFRANDGERDSNEATVALEVTRVLDPPELDLNGAADGTGHAATLTVGTGPVSIVDPDGLTVSDPDSPDLIAASVSISDARDGDEVLSADTSGTGITATYITTADTLTLQGDVPVAEYQKVLRTVRYDNTSPGPSEGDRNISFRVQDENGNFAEATSTVTVRRNVAPTIALQGPATADEGETRTYTFTVDDPDSASFTPTDNSPDCGTGGDLVAGSLGLTADGGSFSCRFPDGPANTTVRVRVADDLGAASEASALDVTVSNVAPSVELTGAGAVREGQSAAYAYRIADPGDDTHATVREGCGVGGAYTDTPEKDAFRCAFPDGPADPTVSATVADSDGAETSASVGVRVGNVAPAVSLSGPATAREGQSRRFAFTITDPGRDAFSFAAGFPRCGEGGRVAGREVGAGGGSFSCRFTKAPATAVVSVSVSDSDGAASGAANRRVRVSPAPDTGGGNGGGGNGADATAPRLLSAGQSTTGGNGGGRSVVLVARFSEAMDPQTVNSRTFSLKKAGGAKVAADVRLQDGGRQAVLVPRRPLERGVRYTATVTRGMEDRAGNALAEGERWSFTPRGQGVDRP